MLVRPMTMKPCRRSRATTGASWAAAGASFSTMEPAGVGWPCSSNRSFSVMGMPAQGLGARPTRRSASMARASARAAVAWTVMKARLPSPLGSAMRSSAASTKASAEMRPLARAAAASAICCMRRCWPRIDPNGKAGRGYSASFAGGTRTTSSMASGNSRTPSIQPSKSWNPASVLSPSTIAAPLHPTFHNVICIRKSSAPPSVNFRLGRRRAGFQEVEVAALVGLA